MTKTLYKGPIAQILKPLQGVCGIVEKRSHLPILASVLLRQDGHILTMMASDIEMQGATIIENAAAGQWAYAVSADKMTAILRAMPSSGEVAITADDEQRITIKSGSFRARILSMPGDDYPIMASDTDSAVRVTIPASHLADILTRTHRAMAQQDIRYYLNGALLDLAGSTLAIVATDGHRLAYAAAQTSAPADCRQQSILPRKAVLTLIKLLAGRIDEIAVTLSSNQARFAIGNTEFISKTIDGKFPDYNRIMPPMETAPMAISNAGFAESLSRASLLTSDKFKGIRTIFGSGELQITATNAEAEEASESIAIDYAGAEIDAGFNVNYIIDGLASIPGETIQLRIRNSTDSVLMTDPDHDTFRYIVMPMRI